MTTPAKVLEYWFNGHEGDDRVPECAKLWFTKLQSTDDYIRANFGTAWEDAARGGLKEWESNDDDKFALIILLDQFSRNMFRSTAKAFSQDARALKLAQELIASGADKNLTLLERVFCYLPLEHSESLAVQEKSLECFRQLLEDSTPGLEEYLSETLLYAKRHHEIIERFGRFPHRNEALGRTSTPEEIAFLKEPMSSF